MAISILSSSNSVSSATTTSRSVSHTCPATTSMLLVRVSLRGSTATPSSLSASYGGAALSAVNAASTSNNNSRVAVAFFAMANPPTGQALTLTCSWVTASNYIIVASNIANSSGLPTGGVGTNGNSNSASAITSSSNSAAVVFDCAVANSGRSLTPAPESTAQYTLLSSSSGANDLVSRGATRQAGSSITMAWTLDNSSNWALAACVVLPSQGGGQFFAFF